MITTLNIMLWFSFVQDPNPERRRGALGEALNLYAESAVQVGLRQQRDALGLQTRTGHGHGRAPVAEQVRERHAGRYLEVRHPAQVGARQAAGEIGPRLVRTPAEEEERGAAVAVAPPETGPVVVGHDELVTLRSVQEGADAVEKSSGNERGQNTVDRPVNIKSIAWPRLDPGEAIVLK